MSSHHVPACVRNKVLFYRFLFVFSDHSVVSAAGNIITACANENGQHGAVGIKDSGRLATANVNDRTVNPGPSGQELGIRQIIWLEGK